MLETCGGSGTHNKTIVLHGTLKLKQQTNADRIRAMTDEELAKYLSGIAECNRGCRLECGDSCIGAWIGWLKQEVESNDS